MYKTVAKKREKEKGKQKPKKEKKEGKNSASETKGAESGGEDSLSDSSESEEESDSSDDDSEPPEALEVGESGKIEDPAAALLGLDDTDDDSVYISSEDEFEDPSREYSKREQKLLKKRRQRRERQRERHEANLTRLAFEDEKDRKAYSARVALKRCRKRESRSLSLVGLSLDKMPQDITTNPKLYKIIAALDVGFNNIQRIPRLIKRLARNLDEFVADSNQLVQVPVQLWYCTNLRVLDLRNNRLREISREKGNMQVLRDMNIWEIGIETLQHLKVLRLDRNELDIIPQQICQLKTLEFLSASGNRITAVPGTGMEDLANLKHLDLSENCLDALPGKCVGKLKALERLSLSHNVFKSLPDDLGGASALKTLSACHNRLQGLPVSFGELQNLELLNLEHNDIAALPQDWSRMAWNLRSVNLSENKLSSIPHSFGSLTALTHLDISRNGIKQRLPPGIAKMAKLRSLDASENELDAVGFDDWSGLVSLVSVDLSRNKLRAIDSSFIFECPMLQCCDLSQNKLVEIKPPKHTTVSTSLRNLDLSCNEISKVAKEVFGKTCLRRLDLSDNKIGVLPPEVSNLQNSLEWLNLDKNKIRALPDTLCEMRRLRFISICHNQLTERPEVLKSVQGLKSWQMGFNPIKETESREAWRKRLLAQASTLLADGKEKEALLLYNKVYSDLVGDGDEYEQSLGTNQEDETNIAAAEDPSPCKIRVKAPSVIALRDPAVGNERKLLEEILRKRGTTLLSMERYQEALDDFNDALGLLDKPTSDLLYYRGLVLSRGLNDPTAALADLDKAIEINPIYKPGYRQRSACLIDLGHYDKALSDACTVIDFDMFDEEAFFMKGLALERLQRLDQALEAYKQSIDLCLGIGNVTEEIDQVDPNADQEAEPEKLNMKEILSTLSPWSPLGTVYYRCGLIKRDLDKASEAVMQFQSASDVLYLQVDKSVPGSLRRKNLAETLRLSIMGRSSAFQTMNRAKKATAAYIEATELDQRLE